MNVGKKWVAAGSTATLLAGGLFLGAPAATAAPGDQACLAASTQFNAALSAAGINITFVEQLEDAVANVVVATQGLLEVSVALDLDGLGTTADAALATADDLGTKYLAAQAIADELFEASEFVDAEGNAAPELDPAVIAAQGAADDALIQANNAADIADAAVEAFNAALESETYVTAEANLTAAAAEADALILQLGGDEALAAQIVELFKAFLTACDASAIGVDPVVPIVTPVTPAPEVVVVTPAPEVTVVTPAPQVTVVTPAPQVVAPVTGTNKGLNVQTAVATEDNSAAMTLIAALLAVGVAVPAATAARMRRLERAQR